MIDGFDKREKAAPREQPAKLALMLFVARSCENLQNYDPGRRQFFVVLQRVGQTKIGGASGGTVELDPSRAVNENHDAEM